MRIGAETVVTIEYTLTNTAGEVLDSSTGGEPLAYMHGAGQIVPGLEAALTGKAVGDRVQVQLTPAQGYGEHDPDLLIDATRAQFRGIGEITVGMQFQADGRDGQRMVTVTAIAGDRIALDANHPLAGQPLHFDVTIVGIRAATTDERRHGHVHGTGGHHH